MARTYEETIFDATVDAVNDALAQPVLPTPDEIKGNILDNSRNEVTMYNSIAQQGAKWKVPVELETYQIAYIMLRVHYIALIETTESEDDADCSLLGVYMEDGEDEGIYTTKDSEIRRIARLYKRRITYKEFQEMMYIMREEAPRVKRCSERNLIAVNNGIFDFDTKTLMPFTPDKVFTSKSRVDYNPNAKNVVIHNDEDGTDWDVESWMNTLSDDKGVVTILWQILGAIIRPNVSWNKACFMYSESGNNGKGTLCVLMRRLVGEGRYASIPLKDFGKDFMLEPLIRTTSVIVDENDVGTYIDKAANLKAVITGDTIQVNRKFKAPISFKFKGFMVQCLNEMPRVKDKSDSFYRRQLFIPFTKCFTGAERKYIKDDYLKRKEVVEYVMYKVLNMNYYEFDVPEACKTALEEYKEFNDPVRQFMAEIMPELQWDFVPFTFLYDLYKESLAIPYKLNDVWENMYPDFIFFQKTGNGKIIRSIVDPHGDWLGDSVAKLKGYVMYLKDHPDMFGSVLAVADEKGGVYRYLDLMTKQVQDEIENFTGSSAKELFMGALGRNYTVVSDK